MALLVAGAGGLKRGALLCVFAASVALGAPSAVRTVKLDYVRPDGALACPDEAALRSAVASRLGFEPFSDDSRATLRVVLSPTAGGIDATLELTDENGTRKARQLSGAHDCSDLRETLALSLSVALESFTSAQRRRSPAQRGSALEAGSAGSPSSSTPGFSSRAGSPWREGASSSRRSRSRSDPACCSHRCRSAGSAPGERPGAGRRSSLRPEPS
jgi:hypothetical protein